MVEENDESDFKTLMMFELEKMGYLSVATEDDILKLARCRSKIYELKTEYHSLLRKLSYKKVDKMIIESITNSSSPSE